MNKVANIKHNELGHNPLSYLEKNVLLLSFDNQFNIISANQKMLEYLNIDESTLPKQKFLVDVGKDLPLYISDEIKYVLSHHKTWNGNILLKDGSNQSNWFNSNIYPIKAEDGSQIGFTLLASPGAQKETMISANKSSQNWMRAIFNDPAEGNILIDQTGEIIDYNGAAFTFMQWYQHKELIVDESIVQYFDDDFKKTLEALLHKAIKGQKQEFCRSFQNLTGYKKTFDIHLRPVLSADKSIMGVIMTIHDITDEVELEKRIKTSEKKLSDIAFINAHEVRAPLASILGLLNLLDLEAVDPNSQAILNHLKKSASDLESIIHKVSENAYIPQKRNDNSISA